jgi:hypothetical protein
VAAIVGLQREGLDLQAVIVLQPLSKTWWLNPGSMQFE